MKIPEKIKIGGLEYQVEVSHLPDDWGCHAKGKTLIVISDECNEQYKAVNFLHEIVHAINSEIEEKDVIMIVNGLYQVLKDNKLKFYE